MFKHKDIIKIDHNSALPLHAQVEQMIRELIKLPEYQQGEHLPKEVDIARRLGVSRNTVRHALNKLVFEGLLERKKGVGTKVSNPKVSTRLKDWVSFTKEMNEQGIEVINYEIEVKEVFANEEVAKKLNIEKGTKLVQLSRLRGTHQTPSLLSISWLHPRLGLTGKEDYSRPLYEILDEEFHTVVALSREEISSIIAGEELARQLKIESNDPVLYRKRLVFDPGNRPVEYNKVYYRGESFIYSIDIERK